MISYSFDVDFFKGGICTKIKMSIPSLRGSWLHFWSHSKLTIWSQKKLYQQNVCMTPILTSDTILDAS